jgi:hypothetical protein
MENTGRQKFEETWQEAFDGAGVRPSENLWEGIEQHLDNSAMRRRVIYYQRVAAACVLFAFITGAFGLYWRNQHYAQVAKINSPIEKADNKISNQNQIQSTASKKLIETKSPAPSSQEALVENSNDNNVLKSQTAIKQDIKRTGDPFQKNTQEPTSVATTSSDLSKVPSDTSFPFAVRKEPSTFNSKDPSKTYAYNPDVNETAPLIAVDLRGGPKSVELIRKLPAMPSVFMSREKEKYGEKWWASAGASAGSYSPNFNTSSPAVASAYQSGNSLSSLSSVPANYGTSYSVALTAAHRVSKRWVFQSGMQYMARSVDYTSNFVNYSGAKSAASLADYASLNTNTVAATSPYQLESRSEYISIPVQAGYLLVDRKFGLLLNSGVSSDIFIRNTLTDLSGQRTSYSESAGQNSPYRTFMWSALMSTELSYKMGSHYRLALVPGMRYSLNQVLKSDQATQGNPMIWDVGFRFRYIFK